MGVCNLGGASELARIYGALGSERTLIEELNRRGVFRLQSLEDAEDHLAHSTTFIEEQKEEERNRIREEIQELEKQHSELMESRARQRIERRNLLMQELEELTVRLVQPIEPTRNPLRRLFRWYRRRRDTKRKHLLETDIVGEIDRPLRNLTQSIVELENRTQYLTDNSEQVMLERLAPLINEIRETDQALKELWSWIIGARGERKVLEALQELPDSFYVINDVKFGIYPPLPSKTGLRSSFQADHVVVGQAGVFIIETKYWSKESVESLDLRSPVEQIRLTGKALFLIINSAIGTREIRLAQHHWGDRQVKVRNILAMVGAMPNTEFQYVKMLPVSRLNGYLLYFEPLLDQQEVQLLADWLVETPEESIEEGFAEYDNYDEDSFS